MLKFCTLFILFISNFLFVILKLCGNVEIEHCYECFSEADICTKCENNYLLLYGGLKCVTCDDEKIGQIGCESCYIKNEKILCNENGCKEGYYNVEGICQ